MSVHFTVHRRERQDNAQPRPVRIGPDEKLARTPVRLLELLAFVLGVHASQRQDDAEQAPVRIRPQRSEPRHTVLPRPYPQSTTATVSGGVCRPVPHPVRVHVPRITAVRLSAHLPRRATRPAAAAGLAAATSPRIPSPAPLRRVVPDCESTIAMARIIDVTEPFEKRLALSAASTERLVHAARETTAAVVEIHREVIEHEIDELDAHYYRLFPEAAALIFPPHAATTPAGGMDRAPAPPLALLAPAPSRYDDVAVPFATGRRRAPAAQRQSVAGLFPALPAAPARHALPGGAK